MELLVLTLTKEDNLANLEAEFEVSEIEVPGYSRRPDQALSPASSSGIAGHRDTVSASRRRCCVTVASSASLYRGLGP